MTNEELAARISSGEKQLTEQLYVNVYKIMFRCAIQYYIACKDALDRAGVELDDLKSLCFFAMLEAVDAFAKQGGEYKFTTYLKYPLLKYFNSAAGFRGKRNDAAYHCTVSINEPITDEDDETTLEELIEDKNLATAHEIAEQNDLKNNVFPMAKESILRQTNDISLYNFIVARFLHGKTLKEISESTPLSMGNLLSRYNKAMRTLRRDRQFKKRFIDYIDQSYYRGGLARFQYTHTSSVENAVLRHENDMERTK